ncbi:hypothetical protein Mapa_001193 [Marchantia paleacea]|nr:hypothetical protein Mapa_001193 [Marchantia paleacea]
MALGSSNQPSLDNSQHRHRRHHIQALPSSRHSSRLQIQSPPTTRSAEKNEEEAHSGIAAHVDRASGGLLLSQSLNLSQGSRDTSKHVVPLCLRVAHALSVSAALL